MKKQLSAFLVLACFFLQAQKKLDKQNSKVSIRGSFGIPKTISSRMFHTCFNGIYEANLSGNVRLFNNFYVGVGYQNTFFQNNKQVFQYYTPNPSKALLLSGTLSYNTKLMNHAGFIRLGFDKFFSDHAYMGYAVNTGLIYGQYMNVVVDSSAENMPFVSKNFFAPFIQPEASINVIVDKYLGFSFLLSYATMIYKFDPKAPEFAHFESVKGKSNNYFMSYLTIGVGFHVLLGHSKGIVIPTTPVEQEGEGSKEQ